jgi:hypothetical protein
MIPVLPVIGFHVSAALCVGTTVSVNEPAATGGRLFVIDPPPEPPLHPAAASNTTVAATNHRHDRRAVIPHLHRRTELP